MRAPSTLTVNVPGEESSLSASVPRLPSPKQQGALGRWGLNQFRKLDAEALQLELSVRMLVCHESGSALNLHFSVLISLNFVFFSKDGGKYALASKVQWARSQAPLLL